MGVFLCLLALTVIEVGIIYLPMTKMRLVILLIVLAVWKAALVACISCISSLNRRLWAGSRSPRLFFVCFLF